MIYDGVNLVNSEVGLTEDTEFVGCEMEMTNIITNGYAYKMTACIVATNFMVDGVLQWGRPVESYDVEVGG
jgi:hypothetical protein